MSSETFTLPDGRVLTNVHPAENCRGRWCVIHWPKPSHMNKWPLHWRDDRGIFERICTHGVGHPDHSQTDFWEETGQSHQGIHGCDFCCSDKEREE